MSTYKQSGPFGLDCAIPKGNPKPPCPPPEDWGVYPFYPPYPDMDACPVPTPPIPHKKCHPVPPPPPPFPPYPPCPPYPPPRPEKVDECSKKLAKLSQKAKVLVQMIKDFEKHNKAAILTIGAHSYQFGTENVTDFDGEPAKGMYANVISGTPIEELEEGTYVVDDTNTRVALKNPTDLLQSELARVRKEITLVAAALNEEVSETSDSTSSDVIGVGD